jgi:vacuolar-type H+-ATPase subunit C/Vma6
MTPTHANNLDYLAARLHGRRACMAEAERLEGLCRLRALTDLAQEVCPGGAPITAVVMQRRMIEDLAREIAGFLPHLVGRNAELMEWMLTRFQVENLKVLIRGVQRRLPFTTLEFHLVPLPKSVALDFQFLSGAESLEGFIARLPKGVLRESLAEAAETYRGQRKSFFFEAALDAGYFRELLARGRRLPADERETVQPLVQQEVDAFHLMLVARGKFLHGLDPAMLLPLHVGRTRITRGRFAAMLADPDLPAAAARALGHAVDDLPSAPVEPSALEPLVWHRFWRLAVRAFRRSHVGIGAVVGYVALRRLEVANLVTLSEGIRLGLAEEGIQSRFIPRDHREAVHV